ncbi:MAG: ECF transporter S component [bacterium]
MRPNTPARHRLSEIAAIGIFSALAFVGGYLFIQVPNVEVFTAVVFLAGVILGPRNGMWVGLIAQTLFSILNPYGVSQFPLLAAQVLNRMLVGVTGGLLQSILELEKRFVKPSVVLAFVGLILTWLYDLMAYLSIAFMSGYSLEQMKILFATGLPFYLVHGFSNALIFALAVPVVITAVRRQYSFRRSTK